MKRRVNKKEKEMDTRANLIMSLASGITSKLNSNVYTAEDEDVKNLIQAMQTVYDKGETLKPSGEQTSAPYGIYSGD